MKKRLGKLMKAGETFISTTNTMSKDRGTVHKNTYEVFRNGETRMFVKSNRRYFCKVLGIVEIRTGLYRGSISEPKHQFNNRIRGRRFWQFSYLVEVIEN